MTKFKDTVLNIVATALLTGAVQLVAYPFLSRQMTATDYGQLLLTMGVLNTLGVGTGGALNNTRLVRHHSEGKGTSDYALILCGTTIIAGIGGLGAASALLGLGAEALLAGVVTVLILYRSYMSVSFRLNINYRRMVSLHAIGSGGILLGVLLFELVTLWPLVFLISEAAACVYLWVRAPEAGEKPQRTEALLPILRTYAALSFAAFLASATMYLDRVIVFALLSAEDVALYVVASYVGKMLGILILPVGSVFLTYYSRESQLRRRKFVRLSVIGLGMCSSLYVAILAIAPSITRLLYPTLAEAAIDYLWPANLGAVLFLLASLLQPAMMRFCGSSVIVVNQLAYVVVYAMASMLGVSQGGLLGFAYAVIGVNLIRVVLVFSCVMILGRDEPKR